MRLLIACWCIGQLAPVTPRLLPEPPQTVQTQHPIVCVHTRLTDEVEGWKIQRTLQLIREMGASQIVEFLPWAYVEGRQGYYDWSHPDRIIELAHQQGITVFARLGTVPDWALSKDPDIRKKQSQYSLTPDHYADYAKFVAAFAARYRGRVSAIIPWNEPNLSFEWGYRQVKPSEYVEFLKGVYEAAHAANPDIQIIGGALAPNVEPEGSTNAISDLVYLNGMLDAGGGNYFDAFSVHAYDLTKSAPETEPASDRINYRRTELLRAILAKFNLNKPIYITEMGWNDHPRWVYAVHPGDRISFTLDAFKYAEKNWPEVRAACIWNFRTPAPTRSYPDYWQLVWSDFQPRPIYDAIRDFARRNGAPVSSNAFPPSPVQIDRFAIREEVPRSIELIDSKRVIDNLEWSADSKQIQYGYEGFGTNPKTNVFNITKKTISTNQSINLPVIQPSERNTFQLNKNPYSISPSGEFIVYVSEKTGNFVIGDRTKKIFRDTGVFATNIQEFLILWNITETAFLPLNGYNTTNTAFFTNFKTDLRATKIVKLTYDATGDLPIPIVQFSKNIFQISNDGNSFLMRWDDVDQLVLVDTTNLEKSRVIVSGGIKAAAYNPNNSQQILAVTNEGLVLVDVENGQKNIIETQLSTAWVENASFSPDGNWLAITHYDGLSNTDLYLWSTRKSLQPK